jgi:hypothetical protein
MMHVLVLYALQSCLKREASSQSWWYEFAVPDTQEAKAKGFLESRNLRPAIHWETVARLLKKKKAHAYNPRYSGGRGQEDHSLRTEPTWSNKLSVVVCTCIPSYVGDIVRRIGELWSRQALGRKI